MNEPIRVTITVDHLTIRTSEIPEGELREKFLEAIPDHVTDEVITMHGKDHMLLFGSPDQLYKFLWNVTQHFDLLIV